MDWPHRAPLRRATNPEGLRAQSETWCGESGAPLCALSAEALAPTPEDCDCALAPEASDSVGVVPHPGAPTPSPGALYRRL
eukprot:8299026-Alexandrium_andersonii.AAC.1